MIVFRACGGLGNQLFQYATARRLAILLDSDLGVDLSWYRCTPPGDTPRNFELFKYGIRLRPLMGSERIWASFMRGRWAKVPILHRWRLYRERECHFDPGLLRCSRGTYLAGFWQSYLYFNEIRSQLLTELQPIEAMSDLDANFADQMLRCESVAVHIRRGDYISAESAANAHGVSGLGYYQRALAELSRTVCSPILFVFSDDPAWTGQHLKLNAPMVHVSHHGPESAYADLRLMTYCRHNIIANSSFSWWGAWLGQFEHKLVCAPKHWFLQKNMENADMIPLEWIRI
jgi:hypothetical protein